MESYTLFQVNEYIRRVIALNFREPLWVEAEIIQSKASNGNYYIELVEKDANSHAVIAQASAALWAKNYHFIKRKIGDVIGELLAEGTQVRLKCRVDFNERYGFKLVIEDIDPNFTFGQLELKRQQVIKRLQQEGFYHLNQGLSLPIVLQNVAVVSSKSAAGYQDFVNHLEGNSYGYQFKIDLYHTTVQGTQVEKDICNAIKSIIEKPYAYDAVIIIRGGGSKLDLSAFDNYEIAKAIATSDIPFIIGIGHDIDSTITDLVSCLSLKTPTAVADYMIEHNLKFEAKIEFISNMISQRSLTSITNSSLYINSLGERLRLLSSNVIQSQSQRLSHISDLLKNGIISCIRDQTTKLNTYDNKIKTLDPHEVMKRGYSYIIQDHRNIRSRSEILSENDLDIHFYDGKVKAKLL